LSNKEKILEEARKELFVTESCVFRTFNTEDGKKSLELLRTMFSNRTSIVPGDPYATHAREGAREVILYIEEILENANSRD